MTATTTAAPTDVYPPLTLVDRCDRCGAAARARVVLAHGQLLFCGHHMNYHRSKLNEQALVIIEQELPGE